MQGEPDRRENNYVTYLLSKFIRRVLALALTLAAFFPSISTAQEDRPHTPVEIFGPLYSSVEMSGIFPDSKTFADAVPVRAPGEILADYDANFTEEELSEFVASNFRLPSTSDAPPLIETRAPLSDHIRSLWSVLARPPHSAAVNSSELALAHPYVVPGGRFREPYYWDSYFTMLGLVADDREDLANGLVDNFADFINRYGHIPNGARTYYVSRSQPPFFFMMAGLVGGDDPAAGYARYLAELRREYAYWMDGEATAPPGGAVRHVVRFSDGAILNRYWDILDTPRDESYREDVRLAEASGRPPAELYREIRAAAESGWDFSSRWMADGSSLASLQTTSIVPVDLNSLLFGLEQAIAAGCARVGDPACVRAFTRRAEARRRAISRHLWDEARGEYLDINWRTGSRIPRTSAATLYPLFVGASSFPRARRVAAVVRAQLLGSGGLLTTTVATGQQWDAPNGWAPLQWVAVNGLRRFGQEELAEEISTRWLATVCRTYLETGKLLEKYDVREARPGGGGEYPLQDGFGWTNGVTRALLSDDARSRAPANC